MHFISMELCPALIKNNVELIHLLLYHCSDSDVITQGTQSNLIVSASETKMLEKLNLLLSERKHLSNEKSHDAMKTTNALLIVLIVILLVTVIGTVLYVNRKRMGAPFKQRSAIIVRKSDLIDVDSE